MKKVQKLCSVKGVGLCTVAVLVAETNGFALFENQAQLVSYVGYDVVENQSGKRSGKTRISKKGNSRIRRILHMPALNVVRYQVKPFHDLFTRTYQRHGIKMKSYVAVQKKLLITLFALWKRDEAFVLNEVRILLKNSSPTLAGLHKVNQYAETTSSASSILVQI